MRICGIQVPIIIIKGHSLRRACRQPAPILIYNYRITGLLWMSGLTCYSSLGLAPQREQKPGKGP